MNSPSSWQSLPTKLSINNTEVAAIPDYSKQVDRSIALLTAAWIHQVAVDSVSDLQIAETTIFDAFNRFSHVPFHERELLQKFVSDLFKAELQNARAIELKLHLTKLKIAPVSLPRRIPVAPERQITPQNTPPTPSPTQRMSAMVKVILNTNNEPRSLEPIDMFELLSKDGDNPIHAKNEQEKEKDEQYIRQVITLFLQDYLFPKAEKDSYEELLHIELHAKLQIALEKVVRLYCFPESIRLETVHKQTLLSLIKGAQLFISHIAEAQRNWKNQLNETEESFLLSEIDRLRSQSQLPPILGNNFQESILKRRKVEALNRILPLIASRFQIELEDSYSMIIAFSSLISNRLAQFIDKIIDSDTLQIMIHKMMQEKMALKRLSVEPSAIPRLPNDPAFEKPIGILLAQMFKDITSIVETTGPTHLQISIIQSFLTNYSERNGRKLLKELQKILLIPSRLDLIQILTHLLWKQESTTWEPYLISTHYREATSTEIESLKKRLGTELYTNFLLLLKNAKDQSTGIKKFAASVSFEAVKEIQPMKSYTEQLAPKLYRWILSPKIIFTLMIYLLEAIPEVKQNNGKQEVPLNK